MTRRLNTMLLILVFITSTICAEAQNKPPVAINDYAVTIAEYPVTINVLANDYSEDNHPIEIRHIGVSEHGVITVEDSCITYISSFIFAGIDSLYYTIFDLNNGLYSSAGYIYIDVRDSSFAYLDINNYYARINAFGNHFWDFQDRSFPEFNTILEIPRGSQKGTIFRSSFWIGAQDSLNNVHVAAEFDRGWPYWNGALRDFWSGPCMDSLYYGFQNDSLWNRVWKLNRTDIGYHKSHWWESGYSPIEEILNWPGNGDTTMGQSFNLAPFIDVNHNEIYEPMKGDYPKIWGDQSIFLIFNDDRNIHTCTKGEKLKVEVHGWAYAFDCQEDSAFYNTLFFHYDIYNRSSNEYRQTFVGTQTDFELGYFHDNFMACDLYRNSNYCYNGCSIDGNGGVNHYGMYPPAQSVTLLSGPMLDPDGIDNPKADSNGFPICDESVNGFNFGDGIVDNELYGISTSYSISSGQWPIFHALLYEDYDYYNIMKGIWADSISFYYGGLGHPSGNSSDVECKFLYPGLSDSLFWGTDCQMPSGIINWTMESAGFNVGDVSGGMFSGPFTFKSGDKQALDFAYVFGRDYTDPDQHAAIDVMNERIDVIREAFLNDTTPCGGSFSGMESPIGQEIQIKIYPNPANETVNVSIKSKNEYKYLELQCYNLVGKMIYTSRFNSNQQEAAINVSSWPPGLYLVVVTNNGIMVGKEKFVVN